MTPLGKQLVAVGLGIVALGLLLMLAGKLPWLGKLPGDIHIKRENYSVYVPLTTSLLLSLVLSLVMWLLKRKG